MKALLPLLCLVGAPLSALAADAAPVAAADAQKTEPLFASPTRLDRVGRILAPVYINGQGPFRLVVDTGASHSTISPDLALRLGLSPAANSAMRLNGVTGVAEVPAVTIDRLQAGDLVVENARVPVVWSSVMAGAEGILGVAGLRKVRILVDFRKDRIVISRGKVPAALNTFLRIRGERVAGGLLAVEAHIGGVKTRAIIDTGAERTLGNLALRNALRKRNKALESRTEQVYGATAEVSEGISEVAPRITLSTVSLNRVTVIYGDFHIFKVWNLDKRPALLIGMDVLGTVQALLIDFENLELHLKS